MSETILDVEQALENLTEARQFLNDAPIHSVAEGCREFLKHHDSPKDCVYVMQLVREWGLNLE